MSFGSLLPAPPNAGEGLAILVNANARRGGRRIAAQLRRALPSANVRLTKSLNEIDSWLAELRDPRCIFAAGGDGTMNALLNAMRRVYGEASLPWPMVGPLPLGTGNAISHALGARKLHRCVRALGRWQGGMPARSYRLLECDGGLTFFAGSGWDAQVLQDYKDQVAQTTGAMKRLSTTVYGYVTATLLRTAPRNIVMGKPHVKIEHLGGELIYVRGDGSLEHQADAPAGTVLYDGPMSVVGASTCPEFGFRMRAFPMAQRVPHLLNVRAYNQSVLKAILHAPRVWAGPAVMEGFQDWFSKGVRMSFSRPFPFQVAGEAVGERKSVEYTLYPHEVRMVDWRALARLV